MNDYIIIELLESNIFLNKQSCCPNTFQKIQLELSLSKQEIESFIDRNINKLCEKLINYKSYELIKNIIICYDLNETSWKLLIDLLINMSNNIVNGLNVFINIPLNDKQLVYLIVELKRLKKSQEAIGLFLKKIQYTNPINVLNILYYEYDNMSLLYSCIIINKRYKKIIDYLNTYKYNYYVNYPKLKEYALKNNKRYFNYCMFFKPFINKQDIDLLVDKAGNLDINNIKEIYELKELSGDSKTKIEGFIILDKLK